MGFHYSVKVNIYWKVIEWLYLRKCQLLKIKQEADGKSAVQLLPAYCWKSLDDLGL